MSEAITIWADESTEIRINGQEHNLVGHLITDSDNHEAVFSAKLRQKRKDHRCWTTLHGSEIRVGSREIALLDDWLSCFRSSAEVYFHTFLYRRNGAYIRAGQTYEHYFAKQSVFSLAHKMKNSGYPVNTMFSDVRTLKILFDRRRAHVADIAPTVGGSLISRLHDLEDVYKDEIGRQIRRISGKDYTAPSFTIRFSFISSDCFDLLQFSDCMLFLTRKKIEQDATGEENEFTNLFDKYFLNDLDERTKRLGYKKIYEYDKKFNFFESNR